jgi:hypothetical protein
LLGGLPFWLKPSAEFVAQGCFWGQRQTIIPKLGLPRRVLTLLPKKWGRGPRPNCFRRDAKPRLHWDDFQIGFECMAFPILFGEPVCLIRLVAKAHVQIGKAFSDFLCPGRPIHVNPTQNKSFWPSPPESPGNPRNGDSLGPSRKLTS